MNLLRERASARDESPIYDDEMPPWEEYESPDDKKAPPFGTT